MSMFREALKALGHGEWTFQPSSSSGPVSTRKVIKRSDDARLLRPALKTITSTSQIPIALDEAA